MSSFADIIIPLKGNGYTYSTAGTNLVVGQAVDVPLGRGNKQYTGVVWHLHDNTPPYPTKDILAVGERVVNDRQRWLWQWIAEYYMCTLGEVMRFAMPFQLKQGKEFRQTKDVIPRGGENFELPALSSAQSDIIQQLSQTTTLLYGITGSGKTEIYKHLIANELNAGRSVLYLVPEIAMSSQLVERMKSTFGDRVVVYHSALTGSARTNIYQQLSRREGGVLVMGTRSSIFLPLGNLGRIIVDDEHDDAYKQMDEAPRYNARDCAVVMAHKLTVPCLLASATPSIESYSNALSGRYKMVSLTERYDNLPLPTIEISDTQRSLKRGERRGHLNKELKDAIRETIDKGEQVMLMQNRRGGKSDAGYGTEHLAEECSELFPEARITRLDGDTMTSPAACTKLIADFNAHKYDILIGTQVIAKGFDFGGVTLVGVPNADNLLVSSDFRNSERAFQLLTQMAGRAGRGVQPGRVLIQTSQPDNPLFALIQTGDYFAMATTQMAERQMFNYSPFSRHIRIELRHADHETLLTAANRLYVSMEQLFGKNVTPPHQGIAETVKRRLYYVQLLVRLPLSTSPSKAKQQIGTLLSQTAIRKIEVAIDVDPA